MTGRRSERSTSLPAIALLAEPVYVSVSATGSDVEFSVPASDLTQTATRKAFDRTATAQGVRAELSLAFVGPYFQGLLAGRVTWNAPQQPDEIKDAAAKPLPQRLKDSIGALVGAPRSDDNQSPSSLYGMLRANAVKAANLDVGDADDKLLIACSRR